MEHNKNVKKAFKDGRIPVCGKRHGMSKLTEDKVRKIRKMFKEEDKRLCDIGKIFNVTPENIAYIVNNKTWKHVK